jgi:hypothetical protein
VLKRIEMLELAEVWGVYWIRSYGTGKVEQLQLLVLSEMLA